MRTVFNLDQNWKLSVEDETRSEGIKSHTEAYRGVKAGFVLGPGGIRFEDGDWQRVDLPHDHRVEAAFDSESPAVHGAKRRENLWYRKAFELPVELKDKHLALVFEGISVFGEIYFNGSLAGRSTSAYSETVLDITPRAHFGNAENLLAVHVDGKGCEGWWYEGTGIYRHVRLYVKELLHIAHNGVFIKPVRKEDGSWQVTAQIEAENSAYLPCEGATAELLLYDDGGALVASAQKEFSAEADEITAVELDICLRTVRLWELDSPTLYRAVCRILKNGECLDEETVSFGFRSFYFDNEQGFFLNGKRVFLKGVCCHQDHAGTGVALPDSIQEMRIKKLKEFGINAYRCSHNPPAKEILEACDRHGILVMDENRRFETNEDTLKNLTTLVKRDRNHPCVVLWSLFNEENLQGEAEGGRIFAKLKSTVKKLDSTRPITGAQNNNFFTGEGACYEMDVIGVNYYYSRIDKVREAYPHIPTFGSENCSAVAVRGQQTTELASNLIEDFDNYAVPWGCTVQQAWKVVSKRPWIAGLFIWTGFDYRGEPTPFTYPTVNSLFGIFDLCGFPKASAYVAKAWFREEPMMKLLHHWNHKPGETVRIMTVTNASEVELFVNGSSMGRRESSLGAQCYWELPFVPGVLTAVGYQNGKKVCEDSLKTPGKAARVLATAHKTKVINNGFDAVAIDVCICDEEGTVIENATDGISFSAVGDCEILGVGNGNPNSHEADCATERALFAGRCQAIVRIRDRAASASVAVSSQGLQSANISFEIEQVPSENFVKESKSRAIHEFTVSLNSFPEKPDPHTVIADYDMNNYVCVSMNAREWQDYEAGWKLYRAKVKLPCTNGENRKAYFNIPALKAKEMELWINGALIDSWKAEDSEEKNPPTVSRRILFDTLGEDQFELTLLLRAQAGYAGICGGYNDLMLALEE